MENPAEWTLTIQLGFMLLHQCRISAALLPRTRRFKKKKRKEHQKWIYLKICSRYQVWDILCETPCRNSQPPQHHEDFRWTQWPPTSFPPLPTHQHKQGHFYHLCGKIGELSNQKKRMVVAEIVRQWGRSIVGSDACVLWKYNVLWHLGAQQCLDLNAVVILINSCRKLTKCSYEVRGSNCVRPFLVRLS